MAELYTASQMHEAYCFASGLKPKEQGATLNRFRYMAKRGLLGEGAVIDDRGTLAFPKVEVFRAAIFTELAAIAMDLRAFEPVVEAAERRHINGLSVPPSMAQSGGWASRGGLLDAIHGVAVGECWQLQIELRRPGMETAGGLKAEFAWEDPAKPQLEKGEVDTILNRRQTCTRVFVDLQELFVPILEKVGMPD